MGAGLMTGFPIRVLHVAEVEHKKPMLTDGKMHITDEQLLKWAARFEMPGGVSIVRSNLAWQEGRWWIRNPDGTRLLTREGWKLMKDVRDGNLLFETAREAAEFLFAFDMSDPEVHR